MELKTPEQVFHFGISPSMVSLWSTCKRRWYNHYIRGMKREDQKYARFGQGIDEFLNEYYGANYDLPNGINDSIEKFKLIFPTENDFDKRTQEVGIKLIKTYPEIYPRESEPFKIHAMQQQHQTKFSELKKPLNYKVDGLMKYRGGLWILENKTTSRGGATYFRKYRFDYQQIAYLKGIATELGQKVEGVFYNVLVAKQIVDRQSFLRDDTVGCKTQAQIDYGWAQFVKVANEMITFVEANWKDVEAFPLDDTGCWSYNTECPFLEICEFNDNINLWS